MSKIYVEQTEKTRMLITGLRKNLPLVKPYGVSTEELDQLEQLARTVDALNNEVEKLRAEISQRTHVANAKLQELKEKTVALKKLVKHNFDTTRWYDFGVPDKR